MYPGAGVVRRGCCGEAVRRLMKPVYRTRTPGGQNVELHQCVLTSSLHISLHVGTLSGRLRANEGMLMSWRLTAGLTHHRITASHSVQSCRQKGDSANLEAARIGDFQGATTGCDAVRPRNVIAAVTRAGDAAADSKLMRRPVCRLSAPGALVVKDCASSLVTVKSKTFEASTAQK